MNKAVDDAVNAVMEVLESHLDACDDDESLMSTAVALHIIGLTGVDWAKWSDCNDGDWYEDGYVKLQPELWAGVDRVLLEFAGQNSKVSLQISERMAKDG